MLTRLHISSFIGLTIAVWLVALWAQGMSVLSLDFIKPFGIVVSAITLFVWLFNKYAWSWKIFSGWYVNRPDLRGSWKVQLKSNWIDPVTKKPTPIIDGYAVIRQTLTSLSVRVMTSESRSKLIAYVIEKDDDGLFRLAAIYRNEPKIEFRGVRSEIHHGSFSLEIYGSPTSSMEGHYWTDRGTKGSMKLIDHKDELFSTYEQASAGYSSQT